MKEGKEGIKAIVVGAAGKMGGRVIHIIQEYPSIKLFRAIERPDHPSIGRDIGEIIGLGKLGIPLEGELRKGGGDVIINFSNPQASLESIQFAHEAGLAIVIGTTGLNSEQMGKVRGAFEGRSMCHGPQYERGSKCDVSNRSRGCSGFGARLRC